MPTLYEFLVRFDEEGKFKGAHAQYLNGAVPGPAVPLSQLPDADRPTIANVVGESLLACLEARDEAEARALTAEAKVESASEVIDAKAEMDAKDANIQALMAELQAKA